MRRFPTIAAAALGALALACTTGDPLYGARPRPPPAPTHKTTPPRPQVLVAGESPEAPPTQEAPPAPPAPETKEPTTETKVPAPEAPPPADPVVQQRDRDLDAYESDYLRQKERLFADHAGAWVVIVDGRLLPVDARGRLEPARSLDECVRAADAIAPAALHRYLFRIGEEGDVVHAESAGGPRNVLGAALKSSLGVLASFDPSSGELRWSKGEKVRSFKLEQEQIELSLSDPGNAQSMSLRLADSSGFSGYVALDASTASLLDTEKFEIPGRVLLRTTTGIYELRRSRVRLHLRELALDEIVPAAVWTR